MECEELTRRMEEVLVPLRAGDREEGLRLLAILEAELQETNIDEPEERYQCPECGSHHFGTQYADDPERATIHCHGIGCNYTAAYDTPKHWVAQQ